MSSDSLDRNSGDSNVMSNRSETLLHLEMPIFYSRGEEPTRVFQGAISEILLHIGGGLAAKLILTVVQKFTTGCSRRARTSGDTVDARVRRRR